MKGPTTSRGRLNGISSVWLSKRGLAASAGNARAGPHSPRRGTNSIIVAEDGRRLIWAASGRAMHQRCDVANGSGTQGCCASWLQGRWGTGRMLSWLMGRIRCNRFPESGRDGEEAMGHSGQGRVSVGLLSERPRKLNQHTIGGGGGGQPM